MLYLSFAAFPAASQQVISIAHNRSIYDIWSGQQTLQGRRPPGRFLNSGIPAARSSEPSLSPLAGV